MDTQDFMPNETVLARIRADIEAYEAERQTTRRNAAIRVPAYLISIIVIVVILALALNSFADPNEQWVSALHVFLYVGGLVALFVAYRSATSPVRRLQTSFRARLLPTIFSFVDDLKYQKGATPASAARLPKDTIGDFDRITYDDEISGAWQGFGFEIYEAVFSQRSVKAPSTVFRGVVVALETERAFPGVLVATRKANRVSSFFHGIFGNDLQEIRSGVDVLDSAYDFRTDNPTAALPLVTGRMAQALQWLGEAWPEEPARIALKDRDAFLLLPQSKNFFELPDVSLPLDYKSHVVPMIADLASLLATGALVRRIGDADARPERS
ncbi:hypothetical protein [Arvimicrobium flavum]|uniref:hypothetical protein n=1 Tax=Arvimicrobium flavum TaxID=3393320 RepID=UPI00237BB808|nr:hypothetical protein [Mesorhizobium shangrilense]